MLGLLRQSRSRFVGAANGHGTILQRGGGNRDAACVRALRVDLRMLLFVCACSCSSSCALFVCVLVFFLVCSVRVRVLVFFVVLLPTVGMLSASIPLHLS